MEKQIFTVTFAQLHKACACESNYKKLVAHLGGVTKYGTDKPINLLTILGSNGVDDMLWCLRAVDHPERDRISRYIAADCAEAVLYLFEKERPTDNRPRLAIQAARDFADGKIDAAAGVAAWDAAWDAARAAARAAAWDAAWVRSVYRKTSFQREVTYQVA
jgi:hypothetical protein